jgi:hypothetical protein
MLAAAMSGGAIGWWGWFPQRLFIGMIVVMAALFVLNRRLYQFFFRKKGAKVASQAILAHWFYLFYSGLAFVTCCMLELTRGGFRSFVRGVRFAAVRRKLRLRPSVLYTGNTRDSRIRKDEKSETVIQTASE